MSSSTLLTGAPISSCQKKFVAQARALLPGLLLVLALALLAMMVQRVTGIAALSPLTVAMILGIVLRNGFGLSPEVLPGIKFALRRVLRLAIILLGFQLTLGQLYQVGVAGFAVVCVVLVSTIVFSKQVGRLLGVDRKLSELIGAGTAVCGASAVIATNTVTRGTDEDVAYAIACVTVFGSLLMLGLPLVGTALDMDAIHYGIWVGASVHEVAQVTAAAFQGGAEAGQAGTVAKLSRVILLAPLILSLGLMARRRYEQDGEVAAPMPWFVIGFGAVLLFNSFIPLSEVVQSWVVSATVFMLTMSLTAMGLETDIRALRTKGIRPLALGALSCGFIAGMAFALVSFL